MGAQQMQGVFGCDWHFAKCLAKARAKRPRLGPELYKQDIQIVISTNTSHIRDSMQTNKALKTFLDQYAYSEHLR